MKNLLFIISIFLSINIQAQRSANISILGVVKGKEPIAGAHCYLQNNAHLGQVTNQAGLFNFQIQHTLLYDTLVISAVGYEQKEVPLNSVKFEQDTNCFYLKQHTIILDEILVESKGLDLKDLFLAVFANIPRNYPSKLHQLKGLYRKVSTEGTRYTHFEEAIITLEDKGYHKPPNSYKLSVEAFRETKEWGDIDALAIEAFTKMNVRISHELNQASNPIFKLYESNYIRHYKEEDKFFNFNRMQKIIDDYYTLELMDITAIAGDTIYKIAFETGVPPPPPAHASGRNFLVINSRDLAILEMQFTLGFIDQPLISQNNVKFEKSNDTYYPTYIKSITPRFINENGNDSEYDIRTFLFDEVNFGKFKKIKAKEIVDPYDLERHKQKTKDFQFWEAAPLIKKYPLAQGVNDDLNKYQPLEEQFKATQ